MWKETSRGKEWSQGRRERDEVGRGGWVGRARGGRHRETGWQTDWVRRKHKLRETRGNEEAAAAAATGELSLMLCCFFISQFSIKGSMDIWLTDHEDKSQPQDFSHCGQNHYTWKFCNVKELYVRKSTSEDHEDQSENDGRSLQVKKKQKNKAASVHSLRPLFTQIGWLCQGTLQNQPWINTQHARM